MEIQTLEVKPQQGYPVYLYLPQQTLLEVRNGDTVRITISYSYRGPAKTLTLYGAIGHKLVWFDEKVNGSRQISLPDSQSWISRTDYVDVLINTTQIPAGTGYDMYAKFMEGSSDLVISPELYDVINVLAMNPEFQNFQISNWTKV
jgi:hypothetical protein